MDATEINQALGQISRLPQGRIRVERLETLAAAAKSGSDRQLEGRVLLELAESYAYASERDLAPVAYGRLLQIYDEYPAELGPLTYSVHWYLKWMTWGLIDNPAIPLATVHRWFDELESRYRQRGYSLRPVLALRAELACKLGDPAEGARLHEAAMAAPRDSMSDCDACERHAWGVGSAALADDAAALAHWQPVIDGELTCNEEPHRVLAEALLPLVRTGRVAEARGAHLAGYPLARHSDSLRPSVALHIEFCALTGNEGRGLEILAEHARWLADPGADAGARLSFLTGVCVLLRRLATLGLGHLPVASSTVDSLLAELDTEIAGLCTRYDLRNGNTSVSTRIAARLAAQPLLERLPLGVRSRLRQPIVSGRGVTMATSAGHAVAPDELTASGPIRVVGGRPRTVAADDRIAEVRRLSELGTACLAGAPAEAEARLREALSIGVGIVPAEELARLSSQLVTAIAGQPDRDIDVADAAVRAAARWEGLSEPDLLHHTVIAARAFRRAERHGEAVALFEEALASNSVPYPAAELAVVLGQFGESLNALRRYEDAARQFAAGAQLIEQEPDRLELRAELAMSAAKALDRCDQDEAAMAAYLRAAQLCGELGRLAWRAHCVRAASWLQMWTNEAVDGKPWLSAMHGLIDELEQAVRQAPSAELTDELAETRRHLDEMLDADDEDWSADQ
ncbi:hypothetical protein [Nocardia sp. NPDC049149]|uniref:hypothetical protein n=1 Tax=Nocardia sp. NPDC049149 TaxID=3364315 RepID=UPI00371EB7C8